MPTRPNVCRLRDRKPLQNGTRWFSACGICSTHCAVISKGIGVGPRKPGLHPYATFSSNSVFLCFYNRSYKTPPRSGKSPKGFFNCYTPSSGTVNTKSDFLRLLLHIIDESSTPFDSYTPFPGRKNLEATSPYALQILET
ncbi:conserved hypothetical protein [Culex quinquefasciatus]|uniref:Uncharacterized protein n=1 Tax=Culex quinquefasciatus TaxID=7176 RepID=B0XAB2_CULQU|nr:conserved hypothetical protein [Culex quinquefasciatus]|eukprot:XP_001866584.1 conserved hypothetical protein [Culex quinquefasciatus]